MAALRACGIEAELASNGLGRIMVEDRLGERPQVLGNAAGAGAAGAPGTERGAGTREIVDELSGHRVASST
jgi:hypothetical protein